MNMYLEVFFVYIVRTYEIIVAYILLIFPKSNMYFFQS